VLWHGRVIDHTVRDADTVAIREFNRRLHDDPRVRISMLPLGDGLTLALKN
jgi:predicted O-methyltransferase YrrM